MPERITLFADVLLPVPIAGTFTYRVPLELNNVIQTGCRVVVDFGKSRVLTGIVTSLHETPPQNVQAKYLLDLLEETPSVNSLQLQFWNWLAEYYLCTPGEVMKAALPSGLKISSQSRIQLNPGFELAEETEQFSDREMRLLNALQQEDSVTYDRAAEVLGVKNIYQILKYLTTRRAIILFEETKEKFKPKKLKRIRLKPAYLQEDALNALFDKLQGSARQEELLLAYLSKVPVQLKPELNQQGIARADLLSVNGKKLSAFSLGTLVKKGVFENFEQVVSRFDEAMAHSKARLGQEALQLSAAQQKAEEQLLSVFAKKDIALLFGVTGSGKTEIYIDLVNKVIANESQALLLVPEIVLTAQIVARLRKVFGKRLGVYHSKFSDNERVEVWQGVQEGRFDIVIAVRSGIFLPFSNLGLIVVDEEHEASYKQYDPAPRYHARDAATVLGRMHHARVLLGSATPSIESYYLAKTGKIGLVKLAERYKGAQMPHYRLVDLRHERKFKKMKGEFSSELLNELETTIEQHRQAILFQNRRGYAPYLTCQECAWIPKCSNCAVSLTYHLYRNELRCHYCGHTQAPPAACSSCGSTNVKTVGSGTERLEDDLKLLLDTARVQRMDLDTTRRKFSYQKIISDFEEQKIDVLVGTQMVSKGLDFDHVRLVGVFDADRMLHFPDFRSHERTFQMITQVGGRAGRRQDKGLVLIQTANTEQTVLKQVMRYDYEGFYAQEIQERQSYFYPPFSRLIRLTIRNENRAFTEQAADLIANRLRQKLGKQRVLGPEEPIINRIRNLYLFNVLIKLERDRVNLKAIKKTVVEELRQIKSQPKYKRIDVVTDVDNL